MSPEAIALVMNVLASLDEKTAGFTPIDRDAVLGFLIRELETRKVAQVVEVCIERVERARRDRSEADIESIVRTTVHSRTPIAADYDQTLAELIAIVGRRAS